MPRNPIDIVKEAKETGFIEFGGEYSFPTTMNIDDAEAKLFDIACQIGGMVYRDGLSLKVYCCYESGYYELEWFKADEGIYRVKYWRAIVAGINE